MIIAPAVDLSNDDDILEAVVSNPSVKDAVSAFLSSTARVGLLRTCIHVLQSELCCVELEAGRGVVLASSEATTCVIGVVLCPSSSKASVAHFDESCCSSSETVERWLRGMKEPRVYLAGGYQDSSGTGGRVASAILSFLHLRPDLKASIRLACLSHLNTNPDGSPIVSCLAVDTASQTPTRGGVEDRGPQLLHGRARFWVEGGTKMRELVYDSRSGTLTVPGYQATLQGWKRGFFKYVMSLPDEEMIKHVSTSPEHENAEFIPDLRRVFNWILQQQADDINVPTETFIWVSGQGWVQPP